MSGGFVAYYCKVRRLVLGCRYVSPVVISVKYCNVNCGFTCNSVLRYLQCGLYLSLIGICDLSVQDFCLVDDAASGVLHVKCDVCGFCWTVVFDFDLNCHVVSWVETGLVMILRVQ